MFAIVPINCKLLMLMTLYYLPLPPKNSSSQLIKKVAVAPVKQLAQVGTTVVTTVPKPSPVQVSCDLWPCAHWSFSHLSLLFIVSYFLKRAIQ